MKKLVKKGLISIESLCLVLLISFTVNQAEADNNIYAGLHNTAFGVNYKNFQEYSSQWEVRDTITINNYKSIAEDLIYKMDSFINAKAKRDAILDKFYQRLYNVTQFNKTLEPQLKALCRYDLSCVQKFDEISKGMLETAAIFRLLKEAKDAEEAVIPKYLNFKKKFNEMESKVASGGFLVLSDLGLDLQYGVYGAFRNIKSMIDETYATSSIFFEKGFALKGNYRGRDGGVGVSFDLAKPQLKIYRWFCATPIEATLDLKKGILLSSDPSAKRLPLSYFVNLINDEELKGSCKKKLFGSPSFELEANNKLKVSYKEFSYKTYTSDPFGMGGGSGWKTHTKRKRLSAEIY